MGGGGRPRSANAQRGTVVVDGTTYEYVAHTDKDPSRWRLYFNEPGGKQITGGFKNGDVADEPTIALRVREKLARMRAAAAEAPAPAPAQELSPFRNQKREPKQVELPNVSPSAAAEFRRPTWAEQQASARRNKQARDIIDARLAEADHLDTKVQRLAGPRRARAHRVLGRPAAQQIQRRREVLLAPRPRLEHDRNSAQKRPARPRRAFRGKKRALLVP